MTLTVRTQRRGAILAAALVCLLVIMLFAAAVARSILLRQQTTRVDERQMQCFWVAESAAMRAIAKSHENATYRGEVWHVSAMVRGTPVQGIAEIQVDSVPGAESKQVKIIARWPDKPVERVLRIKEFKIQSDPTGAAP